MTNKFNPFGMKNYHKFAQVFDTVHNMTRDEMIKLLSELGATDAIGAVNDYTEPEEIGPKWFEARAEIMSKMTA